MCKINEATFEASLNAVLRKTFPWIKPEEIRHQEVFTVNLGRNAYKVDGTAASKTAHPRLDILITHNNKNLAVLELKSPSEKLTLNDEKQGISYARLLDDIAPLTIITNGADTRVINTYTGERLENHISESMLKNTLETASKMATQGVAEAILCILDGNIGAWKKVVNGLTKQHFDEAINENKRNSAFFQRNILDLIIEDIRNQDNNLILLHGDAMIGKTMLLYNMFLQQEKNLLYYMLYLPEEIQGIFEITARMLTSYLECKISPSDAELLLSRYSSNASERLIIVFDDLKPSAVQSIEDILTITAYYPSKFGTGISIIAAFNSLYKKSLTIKPNGRDHTLLQRRAKKEYCLTALDDSEMKQTCEMLAHHKIGFMKGSEYNSLYREPSLLDMLVSHASQEIKGDDFIAKYPPVINESLFDFAEDIYDNDIRLSLRKIVKKIVSDFQDRKLLPAEFQLASLRYFSILDVSIEEILSVNEIQRLRDAGYVKKLYTNDEAFYAMCLQRLTAVIFKDVATSFIKQLGTDVEEICRFLIFICSNIRLGELIAASSLYKALRESDLFFEITDVLYHSKPSKENIEISDTSRVSMDFQGKYIEFDKRWFDDFTNKKKIVYKKTSLMPWLILSHILCMEKINHLPVLLDMASFEGILISPELMTNKPLYVHERHDGTEFLCPESGIIEVITYAIFTNIIEFDDNELIQFCDIVENKKNLIFLVNRVYTALVAALGVSGVNNELIRGRAARINDIMC